MTFWIIICAIALIVALILVRAVMRAGQAAPEAAAAYDLQVYRDQLAEVENDVRRGVVSAEDAERVRTEIARRILAADAAAGEQAATRDGPGIALVIASAAMLIAGSLALYAWLGSPGYGDLARADRIAFAEELRANRPSQEAAEADMPPGLEPEGVSEDFRTLMARLRETVAQRPGDMQGHVLLAQNEARLGNFSAAAKAQEQVIRLSGDAVTAEAIADYGELLVLAAGGYVSPEAETAFRAALAADQGDGRAMYYMGLMQVQTGRPDIAFRIWNGLLRRGPADAAWIAPIRAQITAVADLAGEAFELPPVEAVSAPGPSAADIEAAADMTPQERMEMIGGMVDGLSERLATEGGPPRDWARLITSLAILGQNDRALAIYDNALEVFGADPGAVDIIRAAGSQAGIAE